MCGVCPGGAACLGVAGAAGVSGIRRGACLLCRLLTLPLDFFSAPIPPAPFPAGRGRILLYFAGGSAPGTPASDRLRHLQNLPNNKYPAAEPGRHHLPGTLSIVFAANHGFSPGDARGGAPCMK